MGLREQKKQATRQALREAALQLALERGPENVRVDDIADAAGVSPRTYNNYFASREHAIVAAITTEREARVAAAVLAHPPGTRLAEAVVESIINQYTNPDDHARDALLLITTRPALRQAFLHTTTAIEGPLADAIAQRLTNTDTGPATAAVTDARTGAGGRAGAGARVGSGIGAGVDAKPGARVARVLAASVAAAVRVALEQWVQPVGDSGLVVPEGALADLLRAALAPLVPALDAAE